MGRYHQTTDPGTSVVEVQRKTMAFSKAFILSLLGLALSRPNSSLMEDLEASGMMEESSGLQPRLDMIEEEEASGMQPRLDIIEMNGSGFQEEEMGSADFRMAELFEASGDVDEAMLLVKNFEEELGSGDLRSVEIGSGSDGLIRNVEEGDEIEAITEAVNIMSSDDEREPKKKGRLLSKILSSVGSVVEEIVTRKRNLVEEALKMKLKLSQGIIDAKKALVN